MLFAFLNYFFPFCTFFFINMRVIMRFYCTIKINDVVQLFSAVFFSLEAKSYVYTFPCQLKCLAVVQTWDRGTL